MPRLSLVVSGLGFLPEVARAYGDGYSTQGYDCADGYSNWRNGWSANKKSWCCESRGLGCAEVNYPDTYPGSFPSEYRDTHPEYANAPTIMDGSRARGDTYDCQEGFQNWKVGWSGSRQSYCCQTVGLGCPRVNYPDTYPGAFPPAYQEAYPDEYHYHIHHADVAPYPDSRPDTTYTDTYPDTMADTYRSSRGADPYDCEAGLDNWMVGWATSKKAWCCDNFHRGCERHHNHNVVLRQNDYYSTARNEPYDCHSMESAWTSSKKAWCCENYNHGCAGQYV